MSRVTLTPFLNCASFQLWWLWTHGVFTFCFDKQSHVTKMFDIFLSKIIAFISILYKGRERGFFSLTCILCGSVIMCSDPSVTVPIHAHFCRLALSHPFSACARAICDAGYMNASLNDKCSLDKTISVSTMVCQRHCTLVWLHRSPVWKYELICFIHSARHDDITNRILHHGYRSGVPQHN